MLYVIGLAMILSNKYFSTRVCLELATISTICVQATFTVFGSYKHYAIANADTLPAAVMVRTRAHQYVRWQLICIHLCDEAIRS